MVFIPVGTRPDIFEGALTRWEAWRDGQPMGPAPHALEQTVDFACKIRRNFVSRDGFKIQYKQGMQGQYLGETTNNNGMRLARVYIQGITEHGPEPIHRSKWVPYDAVEIGPQWPSSIDDWDIQLPKMSAVRLTLPIPAIPGGDDMLSFTITNLIQAFVDNPSPFPRSKFLKLVASHGVSGLSKIILEGIEKAGVYTALNNNESTCQDFMNSALCRIDTVHGSSKRGVYLRYQTSTADVKYWKPHTKFAYVGKTETSFADRYRDHPSGTHTYAHLNQGCTDLVSFALCILSGSPETTLYFLAEQVLLCLMGTYRSHISRMATTNSHAEHSPDQFGSSIANATYYLGVSGEVFKSTGYVPALSRDTFGISEGANTSSPLDEIERLEQTNFIRTNFVVRDHENAESIPIAEFRQETPIPANWRKIVHGGKSEFLLLNIPARSGSTPKNIQEFLFSAVTSEIDGIAYPAKGTLCQVIIEVRLDGKSHQYGWARLPRVAIWSGWEQANAFAVRVEWEYPEGSGAWRFRYVQCLQVYRQVDDQIPGSFSRFAKAIGVLSWLLHVEIDDFPTWINRPASFIRVLQANVDFMSQTIRFGPPTKIGSLTAITRNTSSNISDQMAKAGVGGKEKDCQTVRARNKCDLCIFLTSEHGPTTPVSCDKEGDGTMCSNCRKWGLPFCSWTSWLVDYHTRVGKKGDIGKPLSPEDIRRYDTTEASLFARQQADTGLETFRQERLLLKSKDTEEDSDEE